MNLSELYHYYDVDQADVRTRDWFLLNSLSQVLFILFGYTYFVLICGPSFMKKKEPYSLKTFIFYYNIFQIIVNAIIFYGLYTVGRSTGELVFGCGPTLYNTGPEDLLFVKICYLTYIVKIIDLVETVVFVLRKKNNQITFLHVYHHISTVLVAYTCTKYFAGGMSSMQGFINCGVHVIMYTYYLVASLGPIAQKIINPLKPYITRIQILQFIFLLAHQSQAFFPSCQVSKAAPTMIIGNLFLNLVLFLNFYRQNYKKKIDKNV